MFGKKSVECFFVGWGGIVWIIYVYLGGIGIGRDVGEKIMGRVEIVKM